ncbi:flavoprotein [Saccharopolyspora gloriosae]|uniref:Phosphopantothenoylcysteine synthetase/decarboxylase n=1 Tax=Saccharopolyspora gloriosae TaxID=455344 RepID=A0A840NLJ6_9PSEU|nr:phosphopantothenoylcysteine synthetase/decarboxylase [Saccharopolyspora gloriosae]
MSGQVLHLVGTAAPPVRQLPELVRMLGSAGWTVCPVLSETAASWIDVPALERAARIPARIAARRLGEPDPFPAADAVLVAPLTFNTLNQWAMGVNDTAALGVLNELLCLGVPIVAAPCVKSVLRRHPAYATNRALLEQAGVRFLPQSDTLVRAPDGTATFDLEKLRAAVPIPA